MAKSKPRTTTSVAERKPKNPIVRQFNAVKSEVNKVTWPTPPEARQLTLAVTTGTVAIALFLFVSDLIFETLVTYGISFNVYALVASVIVFALIAVAFYVNGREE